MSLSREAERQKKWSVSDQVQLEVPTLETILWGSPCTLEAAHWLQGKLRCTNQGTVVAASVSFVLRLSPPNMWALKGRDGWALLLEPSSLTEVWTSSRSLLPGSQRSALFKRNRKTLIWNRLFKSFSCSFFFLTTQVKVISFFLSVFPSISSTQWMSVEWLDLKFITCEKNNLCPSSHLSELTLTVHSRYVFTEYVLTSLFLFDFKWPESYPEDEHAQFCFVKLLKLGHLGSH